MINQDLSLARAGGVFLLLLLAGFCLNRTLDPVERYFRLRDSLTLGVVLVISWLLLP